MTTKLGSSDKRPGTQVRFSPTQILLDTVLSSSQARSCHNLAHEWVASACHSRSSKNPTGAFL